jgi:sigma-B regulation protein RsbU (phosphoserine phosphatase)
MTQSLGASNLEALLESAQLLHASLDLDDLLKHLLRTVMGRLVVGKGLLAVENDGVQRLALVRGFPKLKAGELFDPNDARDAGVSLILPIGDEAQPVGFLGIGRPAKGDVEDEEINFLHALLGIAASGIENARAHAEAQQLNQDLDQKVQELRALLDLVRGLTSAIEPEEIAQLLALTLAGRWAVRKYAVAAWKEGHGIVTRQKGFELAHIDEYKEFIDSMVECLRPEDLPAGALKQSLLAQQAEIFFPIRSNDLATGGFVVLGARPGKLTYTEADYEFGAGLVAQAAVAFDNSWFIKETIQRKKLEQELELAASIQTTLFPAAMPRLHRFDLAARNRPARQCGGDYYDALPVAASKSTDPHLICVADVSGKGLPASLLMSNIQATLRALLGRIPSLTELAAHTNELLYATTPSNKYVTGVLLQIDPVSGHCVYVNAGHTDCLLLRANGEAEWIKATGTPLGLIPMMPYEEQSFDVHTGDIIALFSDGVTEAQDIHEEEYGEQRLADFVRGIAHESAKSLVDQIFAEIDRFAGAAPQYDDITLFVLKRTE